MSRPYRNPVVLDQFQLEKRPKPVSGRQKKLRRRAERKARLLASPSPASQALRKALAWQAEIEAGAIRRAGIARREGITPPRVSQVMSLLDLPDEVREQLMSDDPRVAGLSIRRAIMAARRSGAG